MPDLTLPAAKEVVDQAIKHDAWAWDDPNNITDELVLDTAKTLVDAATQASKNGSVADAVLEILFAAHIEPLSESSKTAFVNRFGEQTNGNGSAPEETKAAAPPEPGQPEPDDTPVDTSGINDIFPGYDDLKAADIKKAVLESAASGDLSEEEWNRILIYEGAHEDRKSIRELQPEFKQPEPPAPEPVSAESPGVREPQPTAPSGQGAWIEQTNPVPSAVSINQSGDVVAAFYAGESTSRAEQENLPIPPHVDTSQHPPILPIDITTVSDQELSRVATQFHSCYTRTLWLQSQEEGRERSAEHLEREAERDAYAESMARHTQAIPEEKRTQPTALEAARKASEKDAEMAPQVRKYRSAKISHAIDARELKALAAGYDKAVWRINEELERRARLSTTRPS